MRGAEVNAGGLIGASAGAVSEEQAGQLAMARGTVTGRVTVTVTPDMVEDGLRAAPGVDRGTVEAILRAGLERGLAALAR